MASNLEKTPKKVNQIASYTQNTPRKAKQSDKYMNYFEFLHEKEINGVKKLFYNCTVCSVTVNGTKKHNLFIHIQHVHHELYNEIIYAETTPLEVQRLELLQNIVEMVALNGNPFTLIHQSGFQSILRKDLAKLDAGGFGLSLSHPNFPEVKAHMHCMAVKVRDKMKEEFRGRALSLLVDIVTKNHRSILGLSVQLLIDGKHIVRSIGMIELHQSHTAEYLADVLCTRLNLFDIHIEQIFTITTDNAANVQKMIRDVDTILKKNISENLRSNHLPQIKQTDDEISELLADESDMTDDEALLAIFNDAVPEMHQNLLSTMCEQITLRAPNILWTVESIRCAAHKAQLAIKDAIQKLDQNHRNVIDLTRRVAKILRSERVRNEMRAIELLYNVPGLDVETRWGYLHLMVRYKLFSWAHSDC